MSGETVVGTMMRQVGGTLCDWSITLLTEDTPMTGHAPRREGAQAQFVEARRAWLNRTGLREVE
jgi:hypothetical protein